MEENGISSLVRNDSSDAFLGSAANAVSLYVNESDLTLVEGIIQDISSDIT
jgi:hypothetical protein